MERRPLSRLLALAALALVGFAGESVSFHEHAFGESELRQHTLAVTDALESHPATRHFDHAKDVLRPACWACILGSSPTESASRPSALVGAPPTDRLVLPASTRLRAEPPARARAGRGPPSRLLV